MGHTVIGIDVNPKKLELIHKGRSPMTEPGLDELIARVVEQGNLTVTANAAEAVEATDVSMVCVGTPSRANGSLDTQYLDRVVKQIGAVLSNIDHYHVVAIRSTLLPGVLQERIIPQIEAASGKTIGEEFGVCVNPEFLREGSAINDFLSPPFTLIGEINEKSGDILAQVYAGLSVPTYRVAPDAASMVKYASNAYHALKVAFANEIGTICHGLDIDSHRVMDVFSQDKTLNISAAYLRPGFAFGGSCLPKDLRALMHEARHRDLDTPLISSILPSNKLQIQRAVGVIVSIGKRKIAMLGLSFKPGTDDLRESPLVRLAETLIGKGFDLQIYDEEVSLSNLYGRNREYIEQVLPHINDLLRTGLKEVVREAEVLIVGKRQTQVEAIRSQLRAEQVVIDLVPMGDWHPAKEIRQV